jgi:predicted nuclease of predicted toxin-antitoxin system
MNFLADEGVDRQIVDRLRADGHDVYYAAESAPASSDEDLLRRANDRHALLLTVDKDFGELVFRLRRIHAGVILLRLAGLSFEAKCEHLAAVLGERRDEISGAFTVITPGAVRIRRSS